ncbi:hypothetical protein Tco_1569820 [Tanacetum coccineum]
MSHDNHHHELELKSANSPYYCGRCDQLGFGLSYTCKKSECNLFYHKQCENPPSQVQYPFSKKCVLKLYTNKSGKDCSCVVCGKKIKGYHYKCSCAFIKRNVHPSCLSYEPTLVALDGLTLNLKKEATAKCLHCEHKGRGWAYVSSCDDYCYHVICVMDIINDNWRKGFITGKSDPFQTVQKQFVADMDKREQLVTAKKKQKSKNKAKIVLSVIFNVVTGNPKGLIGAAQNYFG